MKPAQFTLPAAFLVIACGSFLAGRLTSEKPAGDITSTGSGRTPDKEGATSSPNPISAADRQRARRENRAARRAESPEKRYADLESILRGGNALDRNRAWLEWIDKLPASEFQNAVEKFRALGITDTRFGEYAMLLSAWAKADPTTALAFTTAKTGGGFATNTVLSSWASVDPEAAIQWAQDNFKGDGANKYLPSIIRAIGGTDPGRATELLTSMPRSEERGEAVAAMLPHLISQGADAARQWIASLQDDTLRNGSAMIAAEQMASADPVGTVNWLLQGQGDATRRRMDDVFSVWAQQDPTAAQAALASLPAGENRSNALRGIVEQTASTDPQAALALMNSHRSDVNDRTIEDFVWNSLRQSPETAVGQIAAITDQRNRNRMYSRVVGEWMQRDPAAAGAWLSKNPVPADVLQRIRR